jgi:hypothetical protein
VKNSDFSFSELDNAFETWLTGAQKVTQQKPIRLYDSPWRLESAFSSIMA